MPKAKPERCIYCEEIIEDGREESGAEGVDWMTPDGDFGCDASPGTGEDGSGDHATAQEAYRALEAVPELSGILHGFLDMEAELLCVADRDLGRVVSDLANLARAAIRKAGVTD